MLFVLNYLICELISISVSHEDST